MLTVGSQRRGDDEDMDERRQAKRLGSWRRWEGIVSRALEGEGGFTSSGRGVPSPWRGEEGWVRRLRTLWG